MFRGSLNIPRRVISNSLNDTPYSSQTVESIVSDVGASLFDSETS